MTGDHLIGNAGNTRDLGWDRKAGIFEPLPGAEDFVDLSVLTVILEEADAELLFLMLRPKKNDQSHQVTAAAAGGGTGRFIGEVGMTRVLTESGRGRTS